ncbi:acetyltransferase [Allopseudospirillum japonicum]|uniref:Acetyltransferase n=1 Tax=Allopseudospirillum japonicum TaxID=64971 RepID=A0A1H6S850_9GAMM|nr:bifunctional acetate--CoA ligase family protein/GNAT family N-acetyltransferase [Allopseudospirillum japonicum]SEI60947.1 acetyltransferase [Allopseudospirillum japonicum]
MSTRFLRYFFEPNSIAVFGASEKQLSMGGQVVRNLLEAEFKGKIWAVNPKDYEQVYGIPSFTDVSALPALPDLAIICLPALSVPALIDELGRFGVKAALILSGGYVGTDTENDITETQDSQDTRSPSQRFREQVLEAARPYGIRIMGPECLGVMVPGRCLNATYAAQSVKAGKVAYIGQSGMLGNAIIDWAKGRGIGFSHLITLGESVDVMLADVIDYINRASNAQAILLHLEHIPDSRHFMTAVREASRNKLVLAIKSGRTASAQSIEMFTPGLSTRDPVYDAAFARAGVVRVDNSEELFDALETLTRMKPLRGDRLAIVSNGIGPSLLAVDKLIHHGGCLAQLEDATLERLTQALPLHWRRGNPVDLGGDAPPERFATAVELLSQDPNVDAILVVHAPTRMASSMATATALIANKSKFKRNLLTSWMGLEQAFPARHECNLAGIPTYISPEKAVKAFMHMVNYQRNQALLQETPPSLPFETSQQARQQARALVQAALTQGRVFLTHQEATQLLEAYGIQVAPSAYPQTPPQAAHMATEIAGPKALKIVHSTNCHPFVYRKHPHKLSAGLQQDLNTPEEVEHAAQRLAAKVEEKFPQSQIFGFCLQPMQRGKHSLLLNVGITRDPVFGPLIVFGIGGFKVNILIDRQVALPPLNLNLAQEMIDRSHAARLVREHSNQPEEDMRRLCQLLVKLSQICSDLPELKGLEINPLLVNRDDFFAVDVQIDLGDSAYQAIMPYPEELRETALLKDGRQIEIRPIRGEDAPALLRFHSRLSEESIRFRYFHNKADLTKRDLSLLTQINYDRQMAFIAEQVLADGSKEILGVVRVWTDPDNIRTEFSVIIRDDLQGLGLGAKLMRKMIAYCTSVGTLEMIGKVMIDNHPMRGLMEYLGFRCKYNMEEQVVDAVMPLNEPANEWQRHRLESAL